MPTNIQSVQYLGCWFSGFYYVFLFYNNIGKQEFNNEQECNYISEWHQENCVWGVWCFKLAKVIPCLIVITLTTVYSDTKKKQGGDGARL